jgi:hypothetical protein
MEDARFDLAGAEGITVVRIGNIEGCRAIAPLFTGSHDARALSGVSPRAMQRPGARGKGVEQICVWPGL